MSAALLCRRAARLSLMLPPIFSSCAGEEDSAARCLASQDELLLLRGAF